MREIRNRKQNAPIKFPTIRDKPQLGVAIGPSKSIKLERIGQKKNMMILDIAKINKLLEICWLITIGDYPSNFKK